MNGYSKLWGKYDIYTSQREEDFSENVILSIILEKFKIKSMVDFGCATGRWCKEGKNLGIEEVLGIDGKYVDQEALVIGKEEFIGADLGMPIYLPKRYDESIASEIIKKLITHYNIDLNKIVYQPIRITRY